MKKNRKELGYYLPAVITYASNNSQYSMDEGIINKAKRDSVVAELCAKEISEAEAALKYEADCMHLQHNVALNEKINSDNTTRRQLLTAIKRVAKAYVPSVDNARKNAANEILLSIKKSGYAKSGKKRDMNGAVAGIITDFEGELADCVKLLGLEGLVAELKSVSTQLTANEGERDAILAQIPKQAMRQARNRTDEKCNAIIAAVVAHSTLEGDEKFKPFYNVLNKWFDKCEASSGKRVVSDNEPDGKEQGDKTDKENKGDKDGKTTNNNDQTNLNPETTGDDKPKEETPSGSNQDTTGVEQLRPAN